MLYLTINQRFIITFLLVSLGNVTFRVSGSLFSFLLISVHFRKQLESTALSGRDVKGFRKHVTNFSLCGDLSFDIAVTLYKEIFTLTYRLKCVIPACIVC